MKGLPALLQLGSGWLLLAAVALCPAAAESVAEERGLEADSAGEEHVKADAELSPGEQEPALEADEPVVPARPVTPHLPPPSQPIAARLDPPETELALAKTALDNLARRLNSSRQTAGRLGLGPQTASAERSWQHAQAFYAQREWDSAIRELSNYLSQTQVPDIKIYLKAQSMLGHAYEDLGYKGKSLRAYFRYLATFLTAKEQDHTELLEVLRRMIPLASGDSADSKELRELLASITSLELPKEVQPLVYFYAAKAAATTAETALAEGWLKQAASTPNDPLLKAKALYMQALLALSRKDYDTAKDLLGEVISADPEGANRDLARLALARLSVRQKEREHALKFYALIANDSTAFKEATFESIYIHLDLKQDDQARAKSLLYLARWPEGADALQLRMLMAYLDMRAGDLKAASSSIAAADKRLKDIHSWLRTSIPATAAISQQTLSDLQQISGGQLPLPTAVKAATKLFGRLAEAKRRLADSRGSIRNILFTIGRARTEQLRPFWVNRAEQLGGLGDELLQVGHRLAAAETALYQDQLSAVDKQTLSASEARRRRLLTPAAASHRLMQNWGSYAAFDDLSRSAAATQDKLLGAQARLAAARFLSSTKAAPAPRLAELTLAGEQLREHVARGVEVLRKARVEDLAATGPHRATAKFLAQYAASLHSEAELLAKVRDRVPGTAQKLNAEDAVKAWAQWEFLMHDLFRQLAVLGQDTKGGLSALLAELDAEERSYGALSQRLDDLTAALESQLGLSIGTIVEQYQQAIDARFARSQKWQGDIHWLTFNAKLDDAKKLHDQNDLEQQILRDNLLDLQQGALWSWPR